MAASDFVGRTGLVAQILGDAGGPGRTGTFFDVEGLPGIGKTRLLDHLATQTRPEDCVVRVNGKHFPARASRMRTAAADEDAELGQFRILLREAFEPLHTEDEKIADFLSYLTVYTQSVQQADLLHYLDELLEQATGAANGLDRNLAAMEARFLVLVDDFHLLVGRPLGQWVITWLTGIEGADVVVTHEEFRGAENSGLPTHAVRVSLDNLSRKDVEAYLASHPDIGPDVAGIVGPVWDFTGGYPEALALVADLIKGSGSRDTAVELIRQLAAPQGGRAAKLEAVVNRILGTIDDEALREALYRVCVTRHFDAALVEWLMHVNEGQAHTLIKRLSHYSFVRESTARDSVYAVSDFVRGIGERRLGPVETRNTHIRAEDYYRRRIRQEADPDETSFESWYFYEKPEFQALERDWLYHLSRLPGSNRRDGRIDIARMFLDAFWWWGNYVPFPFCEQILDDWDAATSDEGEDHDWHGALKTVYDKYPKEWQKKADTPAAQWTEVRRALLFIWMRGGFDQVQRDDRRMRHVRGLLDFFLAEAARYLDPDDQAAEERLDDAKAQFEANGDEWNAAWAEYHRADLAVFRKQAYAATMARESAERHPDLDDHEVLANLHRVCADAQWLLREPGNALDAHAGEALDAHARAVLHAYKCQVREFQDNYTDAFQQEMIDRSVDRLAALHADGQDQVLRSACARIRSFFGPYWRAVGAGPVADVGLDVVRALDEGRLDDVAGLLFPARPTVLGYLDREYAGTCADVTDKMKRELAQPPCTPLSAAGT